MRCSRQHLHILSLFRRSEQTSARSLKTMVSRLSVGAKLICTDQLVNALILLRGLLDGEVTNAFLCDNGPEGRNSHELVSLNGARTAIDISYRRRHSEHTISTLSAGNAARVTFSRREEAVNIKSISDPQRASCTSSLGKQVGKVVDGVGWLGGDGLRQGNH